MSRNEIIPLLLSFFEEHHFQRLPKKDLMKLFKNSNFDDSEMIEITSDLVIRELESLGKEIIDDFSDGQHLHFAKSWLWRVLCMNESSTIFSPKKQERVYKIRNEEIDRKDLDLVKMGEWLLKNCKSNPNQVYVPCGHEELHILYVCARGGSVEKVKLLLKYGSDRTNFSRLRFYFETPICVAFNNQHFNVVKELCKGDYSILDELGWYELMDGFEYSPIELVQEKKDHTEYIEFFAREYLASGCNDQSIVRVVSALNSEISFEQFTQKCNKLRKDIFIEKLARQGSLLSDLNVIFL